MKSKALAFILALLFSALAGTLLFGAVQASTDVSNIPKPSVPEFTMKLTEHSYDVPPIYGIDQFTGENITIREGAHYQWNTLDFTIRNQQFPSDHRLYYNIRYKGQYTNNWTEVYNVDTYIQQQSGQYTTISFLLSGYLPPSQGYMYSLTIPAGAKVDFQVEAMVGGIFRISPEFASGYEFRGETSGWSNTQTITITEMQTPSPAATSSPEPTSTPTLTPTSTPYNEPQQVDQELIIGVAIVAFVLGTALGLLFYFIKRRG